MSDDTTKTNEEIINELTSNLSTSSGVLNDDNASNQIPVDFDQESESTAAVDESIPDDHIDEEALKDLEVSLSDEDKERRRGEALALKRAGNEQFKSERYVDALVSYTEALRLCPLKYDSDRAVLYANRGASKIQLNRGKCAIDDCTQAIALNGQYVRAYLRRAKLYEETDKFDESLEDYKKVLELDPGNVDALGASQRLPPLINERNEKLKNEMFDKLKDLGNLVLKPFGLSTSNFKLQQDPNSGGYSVNFQQNS